MVLPDSHRVSRVPWYLGTQRGRYKSFAYGTVTLFGRLSHTFLLTSHFVTLIYRALQPRTAYCAVWALPRSLATTRGIISFPLGTKMFQFPRLPSPGLCVQPGDAVGLPQQVSLFGYPRINACTRLPEAFRSVPRPSSALERQGIHRKHLVA